MKQYHKWIAGEIACIIIGLLLCIGFVCRFNFLLPLRVLAGAAIGIFIGNKLLDWYHDGTNVEDAEKPIFKNRPPQ